MEEKKIKRERSSTTKQKIIDLLKKKNEALTHKDFQNYFNGQIDRVTIYRALDRLVDEGKLHKIISLEGVIQYAICKSCDHKHDKHTHNHIHFSCRKCEKTICLDDVSPNIILPKGFKAEENQLLISGICSNCNK